MKTGCLCSVLAFGEFSGPGPLGRARVPMLVTEALASSPNCALNLALFRPKHLQGLSLTVKILSWVTSVAT